MLYTVFVLFKICHILLNLRIQWIHCFTQGLSGRNNCSNQAQVLVCSVCNGGPALQFRSFILAKYVTCVGHLYAYTEMIYCSRYGMFSRITSVSLEPNLLYWDQHHGFPCLGYVFNFFLGCMNINEPENIMHQHMHCALVWSFFSLPVATHRRRPSWLLIEYDGTQVKLTLWRKV